MATHKAVQIQSAGAPLRLVDVETLSPGRDEVRLAVSACGICGTDRAFVSGGFPDMLWPLTLGPEIGRIIAELGEGIDDFAVGERVAVGWFGGHCNHCDHCRKGIFIHCANMKVPSWHYPGGYLRLGHFGCSLPGRWASRPCILPSCRACERGSRSCRYRKPLTVMRRWSRGGHATAPSSLCNAGQIQSGL